MQQTLIHTEREGHMFSSSTALLCSLQEVHKAELEAQYLMTVRHPFRPCFLENSYIFEVQNKLTKLIRNFLGFFSKKVNVTSSDRL